jgi:hypothetical protein
MSMAVPRIIHQTWSNDSPPDRLASFAVSWRALNPGWGYRFWTDRATRTFVADRFPWFLATYDSYGSPIMRVDAARYLWMWHFGGVYVDLDMEPVRPLDPLLSSRGDAQLLIAREPASHARLHGRTMILSNAFLVSTPHHPAWREVFAQLVERRALADPLVATGPFLLTDLHLHSPTFAAALTLLDASVVSPLDKFQAWSAPHDAAALDLASAREETVAIHHWVGSWWRQPPVERQFLVSDEPVAAPVSRRVTW